MSDHKRFRLSRRRALGLGAAAVASTVLPPTPAQWNIRTRLTARQQAEIIRPTIRPRNDWAEGLPATGPLQAEEDVRFLLVHHTASTNDYAEDEVIDQLRGWYSYHTGPEKGWPDLAYNFLVDRYGVIWEGRAGSVDGPIRGDATGGSQGFALLCSLIGDHTQAPMTAEQQTSLVSLLAWLGATYGIDTTPGATVSFTSRGSSRWPAGTQVTAATISGHRDMSTTTCPGDFVYNLLADDIPTQVSLARAAALGTGADTTSTTATTAPTTNEPPTTLTTTAAPASPAASVESTTADSSGSEEGATPVVGGADGSDGPNEPLLIAGGVAGAIAAVGGAFNWLRNRGDAG